VHYVRSNDLAEDYYMILNDVLMHGETVAPRGKTTSEILSFTLELTDPTRALVRGTNRKVSVPLAAAEALQLVGGFSDPGAMLQISRHFREFTDGGVFHAPYGPRIATQIPKAMDWLERDQASRKAHVTVWDATQDLWCEETRDHPCTTHMQFMVRNDRLDLHVGMRANDAWRGFPYDVFQFCQLQLAVAHALEYPPGTYYHHATSFHLYEENWGDVPRLASSSQPPIEGVQSPHPLSPDNRWRWQQDRARHLFYGTLYGAGDPPSPDTDFNSGELLMCNALRSRNVEGSW
jgi:thymidylate synthase